MKTRLACTFLSALFVLALSHMLAATAAQDNNKASPQNSAVAPAKASAGEATIPSKTSAGDQKTIIAPKKDDQITRLPANIVNVTISVTDPYGRFVTGLGKDHFELFDDKVKQQIAHFTDDDAPVSLGIVYDVSGSMKERVGRSIRALRRFIETSHNDDDFFLIGFNDRAKLVQDFTTSGDSILGHLMFANPHGSTALYDAA